MPKNKATKIGCDAFDRPKAIRPVTAVPPAQITPSHGEMIPRTALATDASCGTNTGALVANIPNSAMTVQRMAMVRACCVVRRIAMMPIPNRVGKTI